MTNRDNERQKAAQTHTEGQAASAAHQAGIKHQAESVFKRQNNPQFYERFTQSSVFESDRWSSLANDLQPWLADDHILGNRRPVYRVQQQMLNKTRAEQAIVGSSPGVRLRQKPLLNALAQGCSPELDDVVPLTPAGQSSIDISAEGYFSPMDSDERAVVGDLAKVATSRMSMSVDKAGSDALTTATSENVTRREDQEESSGRLAGLGKVFD